ALAIAAVVTVIVFVQREGTRRQTEELRHEEELRRTEETRAASQSDRLGDKEVDEIFKAITSNVRSAIHVGHPAFTAHIRAASATFRRQTGTWAEQKLILTRRDYYQWLVRMYREAGQTVFATCTPETLNTLAGDIGREVLDAHKRSRAKVVRVFVFEKPEDVSEDTLKIMADHHNNGVDVQVFLESKNRVFDWGSNFSRNFAFIDEGEMIATTSGSDRNNQEGTWLFKDS